MQRLVVVELEVFPMRNGRRADVHVRPQAGGVIEMLMRVDHKTDRLVWNQLYDFFDDGEISFLAERRLVHGNEVFELDGNAVVA